MNITNASKISMYLATIMLCLGYGITSAAGTVNFSDYQKEVKTVAIGNISKTKALQQIMQAKDLPCGYTGETKDTYIISPSCLLKDDLPQIGFKDAVDILRPYIDGFNTVYNDVSQNFSYQGTTPIFKKDYEILPRTLEEKLTLIRLQSRGENLRIHKSSLAYQTLKKANFYTTYKDTSILKRCTKQNFTVALDQIDGRILGSGATLNLNKEIMNLRGYCKGSGPTDLLFYGGVCGFATQLFRTSLLMPTIEITKRYPHNERLVPYYSDYVFGDDAALYEMSKQLEIRNTSSDEIYLKALKKRDGEYFVMIAPSKNDQGVIIEKRQTNQLAGEVQRKIYQGNPDTVIKKDSFTSTYIKKTYTTR